MASIFNSEPLAREVLERLRWPNGPECPHCTSRSYQALVGPSYRKGLYHCTSCRRQFTVTVQTFFDRSRVPLNKWLHALSVMSESTEKLSDGAQKPVAITKVQHRIGVTYKTAWHMNERFERALKLFKGPNQGLGLRARKVLSAIRPSENNRASSMAAHRKRKRMKARGLPLISEQKISVTGALRGLTGDSNHLRLERVLRALLSTD